MIKKEIRQKNIYLIYDARYWLDEDRAICLVACNAKKEMKDYKEIFPEDSCCVKGICNKNHEIIKEYKLCMLKDL